MGRCSIIGSVTALGVCALPFVGGAQAAGYREVILHSFSGADGSMPEAGLALGTDGTLFGTTSSGGSDSLGTVFALSHGQYRLLHSFNGLDGQAPHAAVTLDAKGYLYGTTALGGDFSRSHDGYGTVFKIARDGAFTALHKFTAGADGGTPVSGVVLDSAGAVYGTTQYGGIRFAGVVYRLTRDGTVNTLHKFKPASEYDPTSTLSMDASGNLIGTTAYNGQTDNGAVYELSTRGVYSVLYYFKGAPDGEQPQAAVLADRNAEVGTTVFGGAYGQGTVFAAGPDGTDRILHSFGCGTDGGQPEGNLVKDEAGLLYGTATTCGAGGGGVVFRIDPVSGVFTTLYAFSGGADGDMPRGGLVMDAAGDLYGTTELGGAGGVGVVYELVASP